jgi:hypothetical protein
MCDTLAHLCLDPVEIFEDMLTTRHGFYRFPTTSQETWRRLRVQFLDVIADDSDLESG